MIKIFLNFSRSIFSRLLASYLLLIIIPVLSIGLFSFKVSETIIDKHINNATSKTLMQIDRNINILLDQIINITNIYNLDNELEALLTAKYPQGLERLININTVENKILNYSSTSDWLKQHTILAGTNGIVYTSNYDSNTINLNSIRSQAWYQQALENTEKIYWLNTHKNFYKNNIYIFTAVKILENALSKHTFGVLLLNIEEASLYNIYKDALDRNNEIFIINSEGKIISHSQREKVGSQVDPLRFVNSLHAGNTGYKTIEIDDQRYLYNYKRIEKMGWYIVQTVPLAVLAEDSTMIRTKIFVISFLCMLLCFFAALLLSKKFSRPLINLCKKIQRYKFSAHSANRFVKSASGSELHLLTTEYENIVFRLEKTINELIKEQEERRKTELQALQMQINPHFLYNTLNSIKSLVWTNHTALIEPAVNALVSLLKQTIGRTSEMITIEEEINNIKKFIFIQEIRTAYTIDMHYKIDDRLKQCKIPKLLLQPIVENAIFHGIEPKQGKGKIFIYCMYFHNDIKIEIIDNGIGIAQDRLKKLITADSSPSANRLSSIGIKNVDERLKLYFGPAYGLKIESTKGVGTSVTITIPGISQA